MQEILTFMKRPHYSPGVNQQNLRNNREVLTEKWLLRKDHLKWMWMSMASLSWKRKKVEILQVMKTVRNIAVRNTVRNPVRRTLSWNNWQK